MPDIRDFCREWIIYDKGTTDNFPLECRFRISESLRGGFEFASTAGRMPLPNGALEEIDLPTTIPPSDLFKAGVQLKRCLRLNGRLADGHELVFVLNKVGDNRYFLSGHLQHDEPPYFKHGGPHGVDG